MRSEIQPWLPTIRASLDALRESEDITFVEVKEPGQNVRVAKSGGSIVVDVNENDETVHVSDADSRHVQRDRRTCRGESCAHALDALRIPFRRASQAPCRRSPGMRSHHAPAFGGIQ